MKHQHSEMDISAIITPNLVLGLMATASFAAALAMLPITGPPQNDFSMFLLPWMDSVRERGLSSVSGEFSAYAPPYIYLLNLASLAEESVGTVAAVKLLNIPFVVASALGIGAIVREVTGNQDTGKLAAAATFVAPTLLANASLVSRMMSGSRLTRSPACFTFASAAAMAPSAENAVPRSV